MVKITQQTVTGKYITFDSRKITVQTVTGEHITLDRNVTATLDQIYCKAHPRDEGTFPRDVHISFYCDYNLVLRSAGESETPPRRSERNDLRSGDKWRDDDDKYFLNLVLCLICEGSNMTEGNLTEKAWGRIKIVINDKMRSNFDIKFLQDRLSGYMQLYSLLEEKCSPVINWDSEGKVIIPRQVSAWEDLVEIQPELQVLHRRQRIPYFDNLKLVYQKLNTSPSDGVQSLQSSMKITVQTQSGELITLDHDHTETLDQIYTKTHPHVEGPFPHAVHISFNDNGVILWAASAGEYELKWGDNHDQALLDVVDGLIRFENGIMTGGNLTKEAWGRIKHELNDRMKCNVEIEFLQDHLCKLMLVYSLLQERRSPFLNWDCIRYVFFVRGVGSWADLVEKHPELEVLQGRQFIPYFYCLNEVYLKLNSKVFLKLEQQVADRDVQQTNRNFSGSGSRTSNRKKISWACCYSK
ncbi:Myb/SANT-like domain-containing protein [Rhynchospora pubera]|uniref:Myb/SANT-like domain-containing protein n=1 Tax=Rhynchospora pubera TaxID=906938 RepID=A0AAV8GKI7_9POAL|nr:Myb/SANT-like domain-containing protein [Rhynchospora pubera]